MPIFRIKECLTCHVPHEWLFTSTRLKELRTIKALTGMSAAEFAEAGDAGDPDALSALICVLHKRDGINIALDDVDIDFDDFETIPTAEEKAADEAAKRNEELGKSSPKA
jgi:hypothetical protein